MTTITNIYFLILISLYFVEKNKIEIDGVYITKTLCKRSLGGVN